MGQGFNCSLVLQQSRGGLRQQTYWVVLSLVKPRLGPDIPSHGHIVTQLGNHSISGDSVGVVFR
jgi:hypothetical protein